MKLTSIAASGVLLLTTGFCPAADEEGQVTVQFVRVPSSADDRTALLQLDDGKQVEVDLPTTALSDPYQLPKTKEWVLGKSARNDEGEKTFEEMGRAPATDSQRQVVVVIDKGDMNDGALELIAMDLTLEADAFLFVNASNHDISGDFGIERFGIAPKESALLKAEASRTDRGRRFCDVTFNFLKQDAEKYTSFFNASWRLDDDVFGLIIFHHEALADKLKFTVIRNLVHAE